GIARLHGDGQNEPFGCMLHFKNFADAYRPTEKSLVIPADRILGVIREDPQGMGGFHPSEALIVEPALIKQEVDARLEELKRDLRSESKKESKEFRTPEDLSKYLDALPKSGDPIRCGLLAGLAGDPTKIYIGKHPITEFNQK